MIILGLNSSSHDTAAVLLEGGEVRAAMEEERLFRVKHTTRFPSASIAACLEIAGRTLDEIDLIAFNRAEESFAAAIERSGWSQGIPLTGSPQELALRVLGAYVDPDRVRFVPHQIAHAASAYFCSGFDAALTVSLDGIGDDSLEDQASGVICRAGGRSLERLRTLLPRESLGFLYGQVTKIIGFREFDEFKMMGLAAHGNPGTYREIFSESCELTDDGWFRLDRPRLARRLVAEMASRTDSKGDPGREHRDVAAACQEALEMIVEHVLGHYARETGLRKLCLAGGVALNCSMNGRILASGAFEEVFVQPASHDAGGALGAALHVAAQVDGGGCPARRLAAVDWGTPVPPAESVAERLAEWGDFVSWRRLGDGICQHTAERLAAGRIIGWVQGRSELGPRALGNRSILADPRLAETRDLVNRAVKGREAFRPFAPSVQEERLHDYFEVPEGVSELPFMLFTVPVRPDLNPPLGAVTHVDGTARVQTVSRKANPRFWELLARFGELTGAPVLLNTSFNNSVEPIVDSVEDALVAFLTTELDHLVIDDIWVTKRGRPEARLRDCALALAACADVTTVLSRGRVATRVRYQYEVELAARPPLRVGERTAAVLRRADGATPLRMLLSHTDARGGASNEAVLRDIWRLWSHRYVRVVPVS